MVRTQIQLPDEIYRQAKRIAAQQEISLAEVVRRGLEHMILVHPATDESTSWDLPPAKHLGEFLASPSSFRDLANEAPAPKMRGQMISVDTNVLLFALNADCEEHASAREFLERCKGRDDVAMAELVLVELYVLMRNPAVLRRPLSAPAAAAVCQVLRRHPRWALVESAVVMSEVWKRVGQPNVARRRIFDARLALTLRHHGVVELVTDNVRDFEGFGFEKVWSPIRR